MAADSNLLFMRCEELRSEISKLENEINKRILIIDVRNAALYNRCHLHLDKRHDISSISRKMRVMNIDPDQLGVVTAKKIMTILDERDLEVFNKRKDATEVVIIDRNTDDLDELRDPKSKVARLIAGLTRFDNQIESKIRVPIHILEGGFREWFHKYQHFTTDSTFNPDADVDSFKKAPGTAVPVKPVPSAPPFVKPVPATPVRTQPVSPVVVKPSPATPPVIVKPIPVAPPPVKPAIITQPPSRNISVTPAPYRQTPVTPIPSNRPVPVKPMPSTAVPGQPIRVTLTRSHSSPNVAQPDGDEIDMQLCQMNNKQQPNSPSGLIMNKPRFDRTLKPAINNEALNAIRAQLNFGRSPEASGKTISGLQNLGNTCFMNSVIQCLAYVPALINYFCSESYYNHINFHSQYGSKGELAVEFGALVEKLNSHRHRYIEPKSFRESIVKHIGFAGNEQQDSHEFMMMLFDKLHHDLNLHAKDKFKQNGIVSQHNGNNGDDSNINIPRATLGYQFWKKHLEMNKSIISDLFEGIFMSTLTCTYCKGQSNTFEVFNCLSLPIPSETRCHVRDCLSHFSNPERIEAAWECPRCKQKREADKKIVICKLPKILIIHLKRFSLDGRWRQKLQTSVDFPLTDLSVDCTNVLPQSAYGGMPIKSSYNLCAVVNHYGHLDGGHYTAFCRLENQRWYTFDDSNVSEMKDVDVCGQAGYILFYNATS